MTAVETPTLAALEQSYLTMQRIRAFEAKAMELFAEQCGIRVSRIRRPDSFCRGRANCDDDQWLTRTNRSASIG